MTPLDGYRITAHVGDMDVDAIHRFLARSYWAEGIPRERVERSMEHSLCFAVLHQGALVGFARVITDRATFAYLSDVFVLEEHRGRGVARRLLEEVMRHPDLQGIRRFTLVTRDAHSLYAPFGFAALAAPARWMEKTTADPCRPRAAT